MAISATPAGAYEAELGGVVRPFLLRNGEIERFEVQYAPLGIFELFDGLFGRGQQPQVRHVRDLIALALVGGGMSDRAADDLIASLPPSENPALRVLAQTVLGLTFLPMMGEAQKKSPAGSRKPRKNAPSTTAPASASKTSSA